MAPAIRTAGPEDIETLVAARIGMFSEIGETDDAALARTAEDFRSYLATALHDGTFEAYVAEDEGEWTGTAATVFYRQPPNPRNASGGMAHVLNVYVRPEARRAGVATALIRHACARAHERGAGVVDLVASDAGRPVYERLGFEPVASMRLHLGGPHTRA